MKETISVFGCTGSVGQQMLSLLKQQKKYYYIKTLTADKNATLLAKNAIELTAEMVVIRDKKYYPEIKKLLCGHPIKILAGTEGMEESCAQKVDKSVISISGFAGLKTITETIKNCNIVGIANKEPIVCAGKILINLAQEHKTTIIPLDSEHNAIMRLLKGNNIKDIKKIIITASGGPFLNYNTQQLQQITPEIAIMHPVWKMGHKISIDSATMMNKCLELIEAHNIFNIHYSKLDVAIHPQALIHAVIEYNDGTFTALIHKPDMKTTLSSIITWPHIPKYENKMDISELSKITIYHADKKKFKALEIAQYALSKGGSYPIVVNAANEIAVNAFMTKKITFDKIVGLVEDAMEKVCFRTINTIEEVIECDMIARRKTQQILQKEMTSC